MKNSAIRSDRECGRFTQHYTWDEVRTFLTVFGPPRNLQPHYNIAPTITVDTIRRGKDGRRELVPTRWGLIPASGFYEWTSDKGNRQPHLFRAADGSPILAFAGLWDRWRDRTAGEDIVSCTITVCGASQWMQAYHDRMPVILNDRAVDGWLHGSLGSDALKCAPESALREWPVSNRLNRAGEGDDDRAMIEPLTAVAAQFF